MGQRELEEALRRDGEARAREIWQETEEQAAQVRAEIERQARQLQEAERERLKPVARRLTEEAVAAQAHQARLCRLEAEQHLAARLYELAKSRLAQMALAGGEDLFRRLAGEIPPGDWHLVRVNARDRNLALLCFPQAEVVCAEEISGGLSVEDAAASMTIINHLERRLEHFWPQLLPVLLQDLRRLVDDDEAA